MWVGGEANTVEKGEALEFAKTLKDKDHYGLTKLVVLGEVSFFFVLYLERI